MRRRKRRSELYRRKLYQRRKAMAVMRVLRRYGLIIPLLALLAMYFEF